MKSHLRILAVTVGLFCSAAGFAQTHTPATQPGAVGNAPGTQPVKESTAPAAPAAPAVKTPAPAPAATPATAKEKSGAAGAVPEGAHKAGAVGGEGKVWASAKSKAYHCEGTKLYGKTKDGTYMTEAEAKAKGYHAEHGKACAK